MNPKLFLSLGISACLTLAANAATISQSATAPVSSIISQTLFDGGIDGGTDYSDNAGAPGQSFTTGISFTLTAVTFKGAGSSGGFDIPRYFTFSLSTVVGSSPGANGNVLNRVTQQVSQGFQVVDNSTDYLTITLDTPIVLSASTLYEYDIYTTDNSDGSPSANGGYYAFAKSATDSYAGGVALQNGSTVRTSPNPGVIANAQGDDRTFYLQGTPSLSPRAVF